MHTSKWKRNMFKDDLIAENDRCKLWLTRALPDSYPYSSINACNSLRWVKLLKLQHFLALCWVFACVWWERLFCLIATRIGIGVLRWVSGKWVTICEKTHPDNDVRNQTMLKANNFFNNQISQEVESRYLFVTHISGWLMAIYHTEKRLSFCADSLLC